MINEATDNVIRELRGSPTDLAKLVEAVRGRPLHVVEISAEAIIRWRNDDPCLWKLVLEWLTTMDVDINVN
jgi:Ni,Fe-hydrogenase III large subunit